VGFSISKNPEKFIKNLCHDFSLQIDKVLWVEQVERDREIFDIITFEKCGILGDDSIYIIKKRKPQDNEIRLIRKALDV
jgi:hypothetical protein